MGGPCDTGRRGGARRLRAADRRLGHLAPPAAQERWRARRTRGAGAFLVGDGHGLHRRRLHLPAIIRRVPGADLLSGLERIFLDDPDAQDRSRRAAHRLSRGAGAVLFRLSGAVRPVHGVHPGVDLPAPADSDGAQWRDLGLYPRRRDRELGPDDDGLHHLAHGVPAVRHGSDQSDRRRRRTFVLSRLHRAVQRCRTIYLGQAVRPPQDHADGESRRKPGRDSSAGRSRRSWSPA